MYRDGSVVAVSSVLAVILMVGVAVVIAVPVVVLGFGFVEDIPDSNPNVGRSTGEFVAGSSGTDQVVRITHIAGDSIRVENIEILVFARDCNTQARLVDLPGDGYFSYTLSDDNIEGNTDLISQGFDADNQGPIYVEEDPVWDPGETISFRVAVSGCDFRLAENSELEVLIVHTDTGSVLIEETFSV